MGTVAQAFAIVLCAWWVFAAAAQVRVVTVSGPINPVTADYLRRNIHEAGRQGEDLLLIETIRRLAERIVRALGAQMDAHTVQRPPLPVRIHAQRHRHAR